MRTEDADTKKLKVRDSEARVVRARKTPVRLGTRFTPQERQGLTLLRDRYQQGRDQFSKRELARLRFLRWLYGSGQIES
jgi:hypothetical protein